MCAVELLLDSLLLEDWLKLKLNCERGLLSSVLAVLRCLIMVGGVDCCERCDLTDGTPPSVLAWW
jgi:hypothetical protein